MGNAFSRWRDPWEPWLAMHGPCDLARLEQLLAKHGDDWLSHSGADGEMLIHEAARRGEQARCEYLLKRGSPHSPISAFGETPATLAQKAGHAQLAEWLHRTQPAILFLDIDGVLNSQASRRAGAAELADGEMPDFESQLPTDEMLSHLAAISTEAGPLRIVLSSTGGAGRTRAPRW